MAIKLIKACKELNIGTSTAVEFFKKQGHEVASDPNTRIDDNLYLLLAKEFNKDMALKLEAEQMARERQEREIPRVIKIEEPDQKPEHIPTEIPRPKVLGKIDLSKPEPKTPLTSAMETKALGSISWTRLKTNELSGLRTSTEMTFTGCCEYQPVPSSTVTPRLTVVLMAVAISSYLDE